MVVEWRRMKGDEAAAALGEAPLDLLEALGERGGFVFGGYTEFYDAGYGMYVVTRFGNRPHWIVLRNGEGPRIWSPMSWDEINDLPGCPPNWDVPF